MEIEKLKPTFPRLFCSEGSWCDTVYPIRLEHRRKTEPCFGIAAVTALKFAQEGSGIVCCYFSWRAIIEATLNCHQVLGVSGEQSSGVRNIDLTSQSSYHWQTQKEGRMAARSLHSKTLQTLHCVSSGVWLERQGVVNIDFLTSGWMLRLCMCGTRSTIPGGEFPLSHFFVIVRIVALLLG